MIPDILACDVTPVYLEKLKLTTFRNHSSASIELDARHVVITGENGAGKTNILEAVSYLSPGRGMRRAAYDDVGQQGAGGAWTVFAKMNGAQGEVSIGTGLQQTAHGLETGRKVHVNGAQAKTSDTLLEHSRILWLTPAMDGLFTGPASDRRRFLDRMVLAIDPAHGRRVADFEKSMRARNKLLSEDFPDDQWLDAVEGQMAELGIAVAAARQELLALLSEVIIHNNEPASPFPDARISIEGQLEAVTGDLPASDLEGEYLSRLKAGRRLDARAGRTLEGPHRSDLVVFHRPKSMPAGQCSTGEQKALLIGLILAHARLVGEMNGFAPILLLDEIAAHLDEGRRSALYDMLDRLGCQAWMTGTDRALFTSLDNRASFLTVDNGSVRA
jgi:DNA replication and repair protein RecF